MKARIRRRVRRPPDLTSLFDVLFIVVFVALIRAAAAMQAEEAATRPPPPKPVAPRPPEPPADVAQLQMRALAKLTAELAHLTPVVVRVSERGVVEQIETAGKTVALDVPLLQHDPDDQIRIVYVGARSKQLRICRLVALNLGLTDLANHLVIIAPAQRWEDLPITLRDGLQLDATTNCQAEQHGIATLVPPSSPP